MDWVIVGLIAVASVHTIAIVAGRATTTAVHKTALTSGILGLLSFPVAIWVGLKSICIAGACAGQGLTAADYSETAFVVLALISLASIGVLAARRARA